MFRELIRVRLRTSVSELLLRSSLDLAGIVVIFVSALILILHPRSFVAKIFFFQSLVVSVLR